MLNKQQNDAIRVVAFVLTLWYIQIVNVESYSLKCHLQASWNIRAKSYCNSTRKYICLYNNVEEKYVENCGGPDWDRKGSKRIFSVSFTRGTCKQKRYQPFKFQTDEKMSDCIYAKSLCSEEGQIIYKEDSTKKDRACRCDHTKNYSFIKKPKHAIYCIPTDEDCSCYIKSCQVNLTLTTDYVCTPKSYKGKPKTKTDAIGYSKTIDGKKQVYMENDNLWLNNIYLEPRWNDTPLKAVILLVVCLISIFGFTIVTKWPGKKLQSFRRYFCRGQTDTNETDIRRTESVNTLEEIYHESGKRNTFDKTHAELTTDEMNYLQIIHLLFGLACPVVRLTFNNEIKPDQLRKTLDKKKAVMKKIYRKKDEIISNFEWNLLYGPVTGKEVTSDCFDIRLMIKLLGILANIKVTEFYPDKSDTGISAMLSRIEYIRNDVTQSCDGKLSAALFNKYWDDITQASFTLVYSHGIAECREKNRLISRLQVLSSIDLDKHKICRYIAMSETYPAIILQQIISEYCIATKTTLSDILRLEKHDLYHKRFITEPCCVCNASDMLFSTYTKVIPERLWNIMYEWKEGIDSHICPSNLEKCCERFIPKMIDMCDLSVSVPLVLNIPDMLKYVINRLYMNGFYMFLMDNKHAIYHSMEKKKCCNCVKDSTEKLLINKKEWNKLFRKEDNVICKTSTWNCCCQYSVIKTNELSDIDEILLSKICHVAGPFSVLNLVGQDTFLYFLNWTVDEQDLSGAILKLLNVIEEETFRNNMLQRISSRNLHQLYENNVKVDVTRWISKQLHTHKATSETLFPMFVFDKDDLNVKSLQIPTDFSLPNKTRQFMDPTDEENNFLVIVHTLTAIVYPVIKDEFKKLCPEKELEKIRTDIYKHQATGRSKDSGSDKNISLTLKQQVQLFSPREEESRNLDLKLMINILRIKIEEEEQQEYIDQLNVIDDIRQEFFHSSTGVLDEIKFQEILKLITKALVHFGEELYKEKIASLLRVSRDMVE